MRDSKFGPKNLRTRLLPLHSTLGIAVTHEDFAHGIIWGGNHWGGNFFTWEQLDAKNGWSRRFKEARAVKMAHYRDGEKLKDIGRTSGFGGLWVGKVCCGHAYWWCGWDINDVAAADRFNRLENLLCSMPSYRSGSVSQAIQAISIRRGSTTGS